ncbi:MAG: hypothetical protein D8B51_03615 [Tannerella sp.]|nr:MAG: hypothetical protein D8B51_03615 [Tannerella sp.]
MRSVRGAFLEKALSLQNVGEAFFQKEHILRSARGVFFEKEHPLRRDRDVFFSEGYIPEKSRGEKCFAPTLLVNVSGPFLYHDGHVHPDTFPF